MNSPTHKVQRPGSVFTKSRSFSQVLGLYVVIKLRLLSQLNLVLNQYSQKGTFLSKEKCCFEIENLVKTHKLPNTALVRCPV